MQLPLLIDAHQKATLQSQIFDQIRRMILSGQLRSGDFLPTTRALSQQVGISRNTTMQAYERLVAEGYIQTRPYVGTFVSADLPEAAFQVPHRGHDRKPANVDLPHRDALPLQSLRAQRLINPHADRLVADFWVGRPAADLFPMREWSNLIRQRLTRGHAALTEYRDPIGFIELRQAIADHLGPTRGVTTTPEKIVIVAGTQDGLNLISRLVLNVGSPAVVENPCYQGAAYLFESFGAKLYPIDVDDMGMDVAQLPEVAGAVVYTTPSHQYCVGATLSLDRRLALLNWATRHNNFIIEDDYDSNFRFSGSPLTALKGLDRTDCVFYVGTFSKCMGPSLRLGYVVLPEAFVRPARILKTLMSNGQPWLEQAAMADFMASGGYARHLRRLRQAYLSRRNAAISALKRHFGEVEILGADAGMHLAWRLPDHLPAASEIERRAAGVGVGVYTINSGAAHYFGENLQGERHLILGYAALSETEIELGVARLAKCLAASRANGHLGANHSPGSAP